MTPHRRQHCSCAWSCLWPLPCLSPYHDAAAWPWTCSPPPARGPPTAAPAASQPTQLPLWTGRCTAHAAGTAAAARSCRLWPREQTNVVRVVRIVVSLRLRKRRCFGVEWVDPAQVRKRVASTSADAYLPHAHGSRMSLQPLLVPGAYRRSPYQELHACRCHVGVVRRVVSRAAKQWAAQALYASYSRGAVHGVIACHRGHAAVHTHTVLSATHRSTPNHSPSVHPGAPAPLVASKPSIKRPLCARARARNDDDAEVRAQFILTSTMINDINRIFRAAASPTRAQPETIRARKDGR